MYLNLHIMPRWQNEVAEEMEPLTIEYWLRELQAKHSLANGSITRLKQIMSMAFKFGRKYKLIAKDCDPTREVECSSISEYEAPTILPSQARDILQHLRRQEHTLVLLIVATGMRIGEALGLKWDDINRKEGVINIRRSWTAARMGKTKTAASRSTVPANPVLMEYLSEWHSKSKYNGPEDFVFASEARNGKIPRNGGMIVRDYLQPAAVKAGVKGKIGLHALRHGVASYLISVGTNPTTAQRMLRHSSGNHHERLLARKF
jgi:integrase